MITDAVERISVWCNGQTINISIQVQPWKSTPPRVSFSLGCPSEGVAQCVADQIEAQLRELMEEARRQAYRAGCADGRKKIRQLNMFSKALCLSDVVGWREAGNSQCAVSSGWPLCSKRNQKSR